MKSKLVFFALTTFLFISLPISLSAQDIDNDGLTNGVFQQGFLATKAFATVNSKPALCFESTNADGDIEGWAVEARTEHLFISQQSCFEVSGDTNIFQINQGAGSGSLVLMEEGIGMGLSFAGFSSLTPDAALHIRNNSDNGNWDNTQILVEETSLATGNREMFKLINNGGIRFSMEDNSLGSKWVFASDGAGKFNISLDGTGGPEISVRPDGRVLMGPGPVRNFDLRSNGDLHIEGTLFEMSDRTKKKNFQAVDVTEVLNLVDEMPISTWQYKKDENELRHMGPMAQDFRAAFGLGEDETSIATVDGLGVSLAAIKGLRKEVKERDEVINELKKELELQKETLAEVLETVQALQASSNK